MNEKIYNKVGRKYKEVGVEFAGFPADGIWLVKDGQRSCMIYLDKICDNMPIPTLDYLKHKDDLVKYVMDKTVSISFQSACELACEYFAKVADGEIIKRETRW